MPAPLVARDVVLCVDQSGSMAASVVAASHSFEMPLPRSQPRLRSSGGKGVEQMNLTGGRFQ